MLIKFSQRFHKHIYIPGTEKNNYLLVHTY
jgi:hypothetical protein